MKSKTKNVCEVDSYGHKRWYLNGKVHREDGPAVEYENGDKVWWLNDKIHREDGPAIECANGDKRWYINSKRHREDGPAVENARGDKRWYINGKPYTPSSHEIIIYKMKYEFQETHERRMGLLQKKS